MAAKIPASLVKQLRDETGAGMGACKKALVETDGDLQKAVDLLRSQGVKASQSSRSAKEGAVHFELSSDKQTVAVAELNCETDFAAKNDQFKALIKLIAGNILEHRPSDLEATKALEPVAAGIQEAAAITIRENIVLSHASFKSLESSGQIGSYTHHNGKVGVALAATCTDEVTQKPELAQLLRGISMHITASVPAPIAIDREAIPEDLVAREKAIALKSIEENPKNASKPDNIKEKMVQGKLRKFYEERALLEQKYLGPNSDGNSVRQVVEKASKDLGGPIELAWFVRRAVGE